MAQQFTGKVEFLNSKGKVILSIDPDSSFVQVVHKTATGHQIMSLTNTASLNLGGAGEDYSARLDGTIGWLIVGGGGKVGRVVVRDAGRKETITLDGGQGDIILHNADCAEDFDLEAAQTAEPGTVMTLGDDGAVRPSARPYDKTVAGVVSGAGRYKPGIVLDRRPSDTARIPLALVGKTYCKVDAGYAPVCVGDLLTTSATPGHAMKASDPARAFGAVIGKALRPLASGSGLIPILVALQ